MPISPALRPLVTKDIGGFLADRDKLVKLVADATGEDPYVVWTNETLPFGRQISDILRALEESNTERWLLTYVLAEALEDNNALEKLRELVVKACPETLIINPALETQVQRVLADVEELIPNPISKEIRETMISKRETLKGIVEDTAHLLAFKSLHESLHFLQLNLLVGEVLSDTTGEEVDPHVMVRSAVERADAAVALLQPGSDGEEVERAWIRTLEALSAHFEAAPQGNEVDRRRLFLVQLDDLIRPQLIRLNGRVFDAARKLSLPTLVENPPLGFRTRPEFIDLQYAVRDLKSAVLARALKHRMWQDAEKELPLVDALLDLPAIVRADAVDQWFRLKSRILWLTELDPHAGWAAEAKRLADEISDGMAAAERKDIVRVSRASYRRLIAVCFFAMDAMLKTDCMGLRTIGERLELIRQELERV